MPGQDCLSQSNHCTLTHLYYVYLFSLQVDGHLALHILVSGIKINLVEDGFISSKLISRTYSTLHSFYCRKRLKHGTVYMIVMFMLGILEKTIYTLSWGFSDPSRSIFHAFTFILLLNCTHTYKSHKNLPPIQATQLTHCAQYCRCHTRSNLPYYVSHFKAAIAEI